MNASIIEYFSILKDPRIERDKKHKLVDIIVLAICAVLSGAEGWEAIEEYGHAKLEWLRKFIPLENGVPTHDTIARVLSRVSAKGLQECFLNWVRAVQQLRRGKSWPLMANGCAVRLTGVGGRARFTWSVPGGVPMDWC